MEAAGPGAGAGDFGEDCEQLTESQYILAKYRIKQKSEVRISRDQKSFLTEVEQQTQIGPQAIIPNLEGGKFGCNRDTFCQICWCCCVPCFSLNIFWVKCGEYCYEKMGSYLTKLEENHELSCCTMECCRM